MKVLVLNCGSSSIKFQVLKMPEELLLIKGIIERIGEDNSIIEAKNDSYRENLQERISDHTDGLKKVIEIIQKKEFGVISNISEIKAVGHRVVHGGESFSESVIIDDAVIKAIEDNIPLAPLHNPANLKGIMACKNVLADTVQVAVFDTAFHQSIPDHAYLYGISRDFYDKYRIRRYGFHGTSHKFVYKQAIEYLGITENNSRVITAHLGNGASLCAVKNGRSIDTSMGFTPLEGLIMGTRSGDLDPAIIMFLQKNEGLNAEEIDRILNKSSGILGLTGIGNDMRIVEKGFYEKDERMTLINTMYSYRIVKYIGAYMAAMGGIDALVYTAGIGENTPPVRYAVSSFLKDLGFGIDEDLNSTVIRKSEIVDLSANDAKVRTLVVPTNEELAIARDTFIFTGGE